MAGERKCCGECFGDRGLTTNIIPTISVERGTCSFCRTENVGLVVPKLLGDFFGSLINVYERAENGQLLTEWLRADWDMFHHAEMRDDARAKDLLAEVLDNGEITRASFVPSARYQSDALGRWEKLRAELMHENRYFPATQLDLDRLRGLIDHLQATDVPTVWYRARLKVGDGPFPLGEMGAPPPRIASHGRANPAGIPYLYLASNERTAVSEIRPHAGERACVAQFSVPADLKIVDLRSPRRLVSPFVLDSEDAIGSLRPDIGFLERLGDELTRPVIPQGAPFDYVPSQYVCEFIKKCGYAGVLYRSSVGDGINFALFNPAVAQPASVSEFDITNVAVDIARAPARNAGL